MYNVNYQHAKAYLFILGMSIYAYTIIFITNASIGGRLDELNNFEQSIANTAYTVISTEANEKIPEVRSIADISDDHDESSNALDAIQKIDVPVEDPTILAPSNFSRNRLLSNNYFYRAWIGNEFPIANDLLPFQLLKNFIKQHSQQQLMKEWEDCKNRNMCGAINDRKFVVGSYSCPVQSGNRLHSFMNSLFWSVLTNRTLLARYETFETCQKYREKDSTTCLKENEFSTPKHCEDILHLSPWVPGFDKWNETLVLPPMIRAEIGLKTLDAITKPYDNPVNPRVIRTGTQKLPDYLRLMSSKGKLNTTYLSLPSNLKNAEKMGKNGPYFAYGMMFEALLTMDESLSPSQTNKVDSSGIETFFIHSRHSKEEMGGKNIESEKKCIDKMVSLVGSKPCLFYLMSDRKITLKRLASKIRKDTHCEVEKVGNRTLSKSYRGEHGSFPGRGYWEDVALSSHARNGMITLDKHSRHLVRSSTALVRELVEFRRVLENRKPQLSPFQECRLDPNVR